MVLSIMTLPLYRYFSAPVVLCLVVHSHAQLEVTELLQPKSASQSTTLTVFEPKFAIDGVATRKTCGMEIRVGNNVCHTALDACDENALCVRSKADSDNLQYGRMMERFDCSKPLTGRFLQIRLPGPDRILQVSQLSAYGKLVPPKTTTTMTSVTRTTQSTTDTELRRLREHVSGTQEELLNELEKALKRLDDLELENVNLKTELKGLKDMMTNAAGVSLGEQIRTVIDSVGGVSDKIETLERFVSTRLSGPMSTQEQEYDNSCPENGSSNEEPSISAIGANLEVRSCSGDVTITTKSCTVNPCTLKKQLDELTAKLLDEEEE
eukprot:m.66415 g.66415  ORF g.66415 m.66415 type:complete len:323 (+) comp11804_c0_seq1:92-1060(+)